MGVVLPEMDLVAEEGLLDAGGGGEVDGRLDLIGHTSRETTGFIPGRARFGKEKESRGHLINAKSVSPN